MLRRKVRRELAAQGQLSDDRRVARVEPLGRRACAATRPCGPPPPRWSLLVAAIPFLSIRLGSSDEGSDPTSTTTRKAYDLLAEGFGPGFNGPLQLVAKVPDAQARQQFAHAVAAAKSEQGVAAVSPVQVIPARGAAPDVAIAQVVPDGSPQDESTTDLVDRLRNTTIPGRHRGRAARGCSSAARRRSSRTSPRC